MTTTIEGRSAWTKSPTLEIRRNGDRGEPLYVVRHVELTENERTGTFQIRSRSEHGVDDEHDATFVFTADGAGLRFSMTYADRVEFTGVLLEMAHYPEGKSTFAPGEKVVGNRGEVIIEKCTWDVTCDDSECVEMPYLPPSVKIEPGQYDLVLVFGEAKVDDDE